MKRRITYYTWWYVRNERGKEITKPSFLYVRRIDCVRSHRQRPHRYMCAVCVSVCEWQRRCRRVCTPHCGGSQWMADLSLWVCVCECKRLVIPLIVSTACLCVCVRPRAGSYTWNFFLYSSIECIQMATGSVDWPCPWWDLLEFCARLGRQLHWFMSAAYYFERFLQIDGMVIIDVDVWCWCHCISGFVTNAVLIICAIFLSVRILHTYNRGKQAISRRCNCKTVERFWFEFKCVVDSDICPKICSRICSPKFTVVCL